MGRSRSYPIVGLREAIKLARALYEKTGRAPTTTEDVAKTWGYGGLHGTSSRMVSALRQYGLLDDSNGDLVALSDRALAMLLEPEGSADRREAIAAAAREPTMFAELLEAFPDGLPSDEGLKAQLVRRPEWGFSESGAESLAASLRDTMKLVDAEGQRYLSEEDDAALAPLEDDTGGGGGSADPPHKEKSLPPTGAVAKRDWDLTIPLADGSQAVLRVPIPLSEEDFTLVKKIVTDTLDSLKGSITRTPAAPSAEGEG